MANKKPIIIKNLDFKFLLTVCNKQYKHLQSVCEYLTNLQKDYEKQIQELERLTAYKPEVYQKQLDVVRKKVVEADIKFSHIIPTMKKIERQRAILFEIIEGIE